MSSTNQEVPQKAAKHLKMDVLKSILILFFILGSCYLSSIYLELYRCGNDVVETIPSPNGKYSAITFLRACGITTAFTPHVSILESGDKLHRYQEGNIFIGSYGETFIKARWMSDTHLVIQYTIYKELPTLKVDKKYDIFIDYQEGKQKK